MKRNEQQMAMTERASPSKMGAVAEQTRIIEPANESLRFSSQSASTFQHSVNLHIGELVLHGFEPAHRHTISDAVERELTRLFTERGVDNVMTQSLEVATLEGIVFEVQPYSSSNVIGAHLARAIYGGMGK